MGKAAFGCVGVAGHSYSIGIIGQLALSDGLIEVIAEDQSFLFLIITSLCLNINGKLQFACNLASPCFYFYLSGEFEKGTVYHTLCVVTPNCLCAKKYKHEGFIFLPEMF